MIDHKILFTLLFSLRLNQFIDVDHSHVAWVDESYSKWQTEVLPHLIYKDDFNSIKKSINDFIDSKVMC